LSPVGQWLRLLLFFLTTPFTLAIPQTMTESTFMASMTNPDYRALYAELVDELHKHTSMWEGHEIDLVARARALLAQPVPEGPKPVVDYSRVPEIATEAQIRSAAQYLVKKRNCDGDLISAIEYAIARWGRPTLQPVAVSERLPRPEDCTAQGWCWVFYRGFATWTLEKPLGQDGKHTGYTHWLPANALPTPEATND
jgi:hypothetical protein